MHIRVGLTVRVAMAVLLSFAAPAAAHHSIDVEYDRSRTVVFEAVLDRAEVINPHAWLHFTEMLSDGTTRTWSIETGTPAALRHYMPRGEPVAFEVGLLYTITAAPSRHKADFGWLRSLTFPDGHVLNTY
jgi:hypothetical protein